MTFLPHPKPHLTCNIPVNPDVYSTSSKIPKQFADVIYSEVKKLCVLNFISKYLLLYLTGSISGPKKGIISFNILSLLTKQLSLYTLKT